MKNGFEILSEKEFSRIYRSFWKRLYGVSYNFVRDKIVASELVQDVFVKLWLKRDQITHIDDAEAYLLRCLRNRIYDHFDSVARTRSRSMFAPEEIPLEDKAYTADEEAVFDEGMSLVTRELERMPEKTRVIFQMSKFGAYSNDEIAVKMHLSGKAVEYHISQAVKKLRVLLAFYLS